MGVRICHLKLGLRHSCFLNKSSWMGSCKVFQYSFDKTSEILVLPDQCSKCPPPLRSSKKWFEDGSGAFSLHGFDKTSEILVWPGQGSKVFLPLRLSGKWFAKGSGLVYFLSMVLTGPQKGLRGAGQASQRSQPGQGRPGGHASLASLARAGQASQARQPGQGGALWANF